MGKHWEAGVRDLTKFVKMGWAEMQKALYPESTIGLPPTTSAEAIKVDVQQHQQDAERAARRPAQDQEQGQEI